MKRVLECCVLNGGVCLCSILFFYGALLPALNCAFHAVFGDSSSVGQLAWGWLKVCLSWIFSIFWVLPLLLLSKVVNSLWFQDIADWAFRYKRGRPQQLSSISKMIADSLFSVLVQALFLGQTLVVGLLPIVFLGEVLSLVHLCMLYSLYAFEYKWCNMGWELHQRLTFIENNWPYFLGFGLPLAVVTSLHPSYVISGCIFSVLFPLFIVSGNEAEPVTGACDFPLQLFSLVIYASNAIFNQTIGPKPADTAATRR
ncbi:etoposide-induced protein 2.4 homolog isoform X2 [Bacillus rossius redtenbacheri]